MSSTTQSKWHKWTFIFISLIFQVFLTYFMLTVFYNNWRPETKIDQPKQVLLVSENRSLVTVSPFTPEQLISPKSTKPLIILVWAWPEGYTFPLNKCPPYLDLSGCFFTTNRSMYSAAKAVVYPHRDVTKAGSDFPPVSRPHGQYWIWFNLEPPEHLTNLTMMENLFNLTMSYRTDSDIFTPYGWIENNDGTENFTVPTKTKLVAWVVSNWRPWLRRVLYYNQLKNYLHVDVFGRYNLTLPRGNHLKTLSEYKFYLAFENSNHEDYITEKLWYNSFYVGTVPVVMGPSRKNYERFMPPDSFIHVDDFPSPKELASYLLSLDQDDQRYRQYFNWRALYKPSPVRRTWVTEYCKVCKALKDAPALRTFPSIANWFK